jgi:hypothetical protein
LLGAFYVIESGETPSLGALLKPEEILISSPDITLHLRIKNECLTSRMAVQSATPGIRAFVDGPSITIMRVVTAATLADGAYEVFFAPSVTPCSPWPMMMWILFFGQ